MNQRAGKLAEADSDFAGEQAESSLQADPASTPIYMPMRNSLGILGAKISEVPLARVPMSKTRNSSGKKDTIRVLYRAVQRIVILGIAVYYAAMFLQATSNVPARQVATETPLPSRLIVTSTLPLHEIWRKTPILVAGRDLSSEAMLATPKIVYVNHYSEGGGNQVLALDAETGAQLLITEPIGYIQSIAASPDSLFVAGYIGDYGVKAYDLRSGRVKWLSNLPLPAHKGYALFFEDSQLKLFVTGVQDEFATIDLRSGHASELQESGSMVAIDAQYRYMWNDRYFWVEDIATRKVQWTILWPLNSARWPIRTKDLIILPTVSRHGWYSLQVVNRYTGQQMWSCTDCFESDVAVDGNRLYAIRPDASLGVYELETGNLLGFVQFTGGPTIDPNQGSYQRLLAIAASDGRVYVHFADSRELIALGP